MRLFTIFLLIIMPLLLLSEDYKHDPKDKDNYDKIKNIPVQAQYSKRFTINNIYFNKRIDTSGKGELLEIEISIKNLTDDPIEMYIFVIALHETKGKDLTSFDKIIPPEKRIKLYVPYPGDASNFKYNIYDKKGKVKKDYFGKKLYTYYHHPKDFKKGVNKQGKPYVLKEKIFIRSYHLSPYRAKFVFFNNAAVLIYNTKGEPVFRQLYSLDGFRRR